jgi:hypothetical protein
MSFLPHYGLFSTGYIARRRPYRMVVTLRERQKLGEDARSQDMPAPAVPSLSSNAAPAATASLAGPLQSAQVAIEEWLESGLLNRSQRPVVQSQRALLDSQTKILLLNSTAGLPSVAAPSADALRREAMYSDAERG